ncbi:hypothetical protein KEM48_014183 [Puccinia striiformis f. sp. tritici PST-130]|uniref:Uncharacterized protein n=1 Tax=Puccinia striiformis f. sp. tritici PST-78 TaxID=1165861 RepID=A0A0L0VGZ3_9BASI|nr:hypothetical protein H4Q26_015729 [Puccinia striiformis f. sp. tritici PST-130]KAI9630255.1 hypothetical protein KEM48_014183 [Puccinia striiformis f. sp. tritici PST-130]KNE98289.1 hypothetical protein PSTG_08365 [Puccinia striiformis f. sp. tritici PST-78]
MATKERATGASLKFGRCSTVREVKDLSASDSTLMIHKKGIGDVKRDLDTTCGVLSLRRTSRVRSRRAAHKGKPTPRQIPEERGGGSRINFGGTRSCFKARESSAQSDVGTSMS